MRTKTSKDKIVAMTLRQSIFEVFKDSVALYPERPFLHAPDSVAELYKLPVADFTYAEAMGEVETLLSVYKELNYGPHIRVGLALENRPEFFFHFLSLNALGASILPLNDGLQDEELIYQIDHSEADSIIAADRLVERFSGLVTSLSKPVPVAGSGSLSSLPKGSRAQDEAITRETIAALLYTSGTTGQPKGCILTNEYFLGIADLYLGLGDLCAMDTGKERLITPLPVTHMNALACSFMAMLANGGCLIQLDRFHPRSWWRTVRDSGATIMHYLGVMPAMLLNLPQEEKEDFSEQIKFAFGAGCDPKHHGVFEDRFGVKLIEAWAMTETGAGAWITASAEPRHVGTRCFGRAPEGLEYKLIGEEGEDLSPGLPGELLVRRAGPNPRRYFFHGYFKEAQATDEAWKGGWFHTGDVVRVDEEGYFYFVDRRKNVVRRSGENIAAIDVESVLLRHEAVASCVVVPVPDEFRGDEVMALIVLDKTGAQKQEDVARRIFDFSMEHLIYFKTPGYIAFVDQLPLTASEKVKRGEAKKNGCGAGRRRSMFQLLLFKKASQKGGIGGLMAKTQSTRQGYEDIVATVPVTVPYERYSPEPAHWWIARALHGLGQTAKLTPDDIDGFCVSSFTLAPDTAVGLTQHFGLTPRYLDHIPMGGASGVVSLRRAARAVQSGDANIVACVAGDTNHVNSFRQMLTSFSRFSQDASYPYGSGGPNGSFALMTKHYMNLYGAAREDFGKICVAQRHNALHFPHALMKTPLTLDDYMSARKIADPIALFDCVMPCGGAEGFLVMREAEVKALGLPFVRILSTIERHNGFPDDPIQIRGGWELDRDELWSMAGVTPDQINLCQTYDDYPVISMIQMEDLGFCKKGEGPDFVRSHSLTFDGSFPHNTSGGQLSVGQAGAAGGFLGLVEALRQLTGQALGNQVTNAKVGLVSGFGMINYDRGLCSGAAILARGET